MADTVVYQTTAAATPPDATIVATDDAGAAGQVQIIKLAISTDGSATVIPADAANGLDVDVTRVGGTVAVTQSGTWDEVGINDSGNSITVDGTVAATQSGTWDVGTVTAVTGITNAVAVTDNSSTLSVDDGGGALTVDGTVAVSGTVAVTDNSGSLTVDNAGTFAVQAAQTGTWNVGTVTAVTGITNAVAVTDNSSTLSVDDGAGSLTVDGTVTANLAAGTNNIGDVDVLTVPAPLSTTGGGTEATALRVTIATDSTGVLSIDDNGGAITVDGTVTAANTAGDIADDSADSGNPVKIGAKAKAFDGTDPGSVSEDDRVHLIADLNRRLYVNPVHPMRWTVSENSASAETNNELKAAPGVGLSLYITDIVISTDAAISALLVEDSGGTPVTIAGPYYFAANGGAGLHFVTPIKLTSNKNLGYTTVGTSNCTVQVHGFTAP